MLKENSILRDLKGEIGDWSFFNDDKDMFLCFPTKGAEYEEDGKIYKPGIPDVVHLQIHKSGEIDSRGISWVWNGDKELPTLIPSINVVGQWHGFLRDGKLITC